MRIKSGNLLVVAPASSSIPLPAKKQVFHVNNLARIFPAIHELQPGGIVLDYDFIGNDTEKILRRLTVNPFYHKIKIYCYKTRPHTKEDSLLQTLGVQHFIYAENEKQAKEVTNTVKALGEMLEGAVVKSLTDPSY